MKDVNTIIADQVIKLIDNASNWKSPFRMFAQKSADSENYYSGVNQFILSLVAADKGFVSTKWITANKTKELKGLIKKGSRSTQIVYYVISIQDRINLKFISKNLFVKKYGEPTKDDKTICGVRYFNVFNLDQVNDLPEELYQEEGLKMDNERIEEADAFINSLNATIGCGSGKACYFPKQDKLNIPKIEEFGSTEGFYHVCFHEFTHWTGHETRLNRLSEISILSKSSYAKEELIAETGALFLCNHFNINGTIDNSAAYLKSWLHALNDDKTFLLQAFPKAQKAVDFLLNLSKENLILAA